MATAWVFSNVVFPALLVVLVLLFSGRSRWERTVRVLTLGAAFLGTWAAVAGSRIQSVLAQLQVAGPEYQVAGGLGRRIVVNLGRLVSRDVVFDGDGWALRGYFAVLEPGATGAVVAAYGVQVAGALGSLYLFWYAAKSLHPRRRELLDLPGRVLAFHGWLLALTLLAYTLLVAPFVEMGGTTYTTLSYPALLFGLSQGAVTLLERTGRARGLLAVSVAALAVLFGVGWAQSSLWNLRALDRPGPQRGDYRSVVQLEALISANGDGGLDRAAVKGWCLEAWPGNAAFCETVGWHGMMREALQEALPESSRQGTPDKEFEVSRARVLEAVCTDVSTEELLDCAAAAGAMSAGHYLCETRPGGDLGVLCGRFPLEAQQACVSGLHRGPVLVAHSVHGCVLETLDNLCRGGGESEPHAWQRRTCLEAVAGLMTGMPPLPARDALEEGRSCERWPTDWLGVCRKLGEARRAGEGERSCEDIYLDRFAKELPDRNLLVYQQCSFAGIVMGQQLYPSCVIGVAKALEGLECSWAGTELRL